jgi:hypothetical protein
MRYKRFALWVGVPLTIIVAMLVWRVSYGAISAAVDSTFSQPTIGTIPGPVSMPVSIMSDWVTVNDQPDTADNAGSEVLSPDAITRAAIIPLNMKGHGTTVQFRMRYDSASVPTTDPVVQVFGFDANNLPQRLTDAGGTHALTCVEAAATDVKQTTGTFAYTAHHEVDADANKQLYFTIKTASAGGAGTEVIQARIK